MLLLFLTIGMLGVLGWMRTVLIETEQELKQLKNDFEYVEDTLMVTENELHDSHEEFRKMTSQLRTLRDFDLKTDEVTDRSVMSESIINRQSAMVDRILDLQKIITDIHIAEARARFGPGPYRLQFNVRIDDSTTAFVVELAPLEKMGHSVYLFMRMVDSDLWKDSVILHRADHLLYVAPFTSAGSDKTELFRERNIDRLLFPEYNDDYKHEKYTIGFAGRPGGPEFYFNTRDNHESHGPGGQMQHDLHEEADACFGKVVAGFDVVDRLQHLNEEALKRENEGGNAEVHYTVLESIHGA